MRVRQHIPIPTEPSLAKRLLNPLNLRPNITVTLRKAADLTRLLISAEKAAQTSPRMISRLPRTRRRTANDRIAAGHAPHTKPPKQVTQTGPGAEEAAIGEEELLDLHLHSEYEYAKWSH
jgi:hypothetical protein